MDVLQLEVVETGNGFCIAAFDESVGDFCRLSMEVYRHFNTARTALFAGTWTIA